ncbi:hypothetical protein JCM24511_02135 [Saitozyma sp. JCM 24511]|nr:hypothetical protein JCM24511_02135 [Saitozyma sp. JCM 24511]
MDDLQAMIILASFSDISWKPGGHALRMAMAFNRGQPALLPADESIATARRFLDHPLSILHLHQPYSLTPTMSLPLLVTKVDESNLALDGWFAYWTQYHGVALRGQEYSRGFRHDAGMAHAAKLLIKLAGLAPDLLDGTRVATDVDLLVQLLSQGPSDKVANDLRGFVAKARRDDILPSDTAALPLPQSTSDARTAMESTLDDGLGFDSELNKWLFLS